MALRSRRGLRHFVLLMLLGACTLSSAAGTGQHKVKKKAAAPPKASKVVSFKKSVFPIFQTYCLPCHTEDQMNPSELYLETYEELMKGGKHGKALIPANADSSLLVLKLSPKPPFGDPMPLKRKTPVPQDTIDIIKKWIGQGAKDN